MTSKPWHGTVWGYTNHWCRCDRCRGARRAYMQAYRQRPEVKAKLAAYMQAYWQRPEAKAKRAAYQRELRRLAAIGRAVEAQQRRRA